MLLIPSFAIGRTQEIVWALSRLLDAGRIPDIPLYLDSPMAKSASEVYRGHPEAFDDETNALLRTHDAPLDYPGQHIVQNVQESERIAQAPPPYAIVASNGMLTGGRSVGHAERLLGDPKATVLFVGYQGEGTLGGHLVRGATSARIAGHEMEVKATGVGITEFGQQDRAEDEQQNHHRHRDEKDRSPPEVLQQDATDQGTNGAANGKACAPDADGCHALLGVMEHVANER